MGRLEDLREKVARAEAAAKQAQDDITPEEAEEHALRGRLEAAESEARALARKRRLADLDARLEAAHAAIAEKSGKPALLLAHDAEETSPGAGTFILRYPGADACASFSKGLNKNAAQGKHDHSEAYHRLARSSIHDWNGETDLQGLGGGPASAALNALLADRFPLVQSIVNAVLDLGGSAQRARKR